MEDPARSLSIDQLERQQEEEGDGGPGRARRRSRESRGSAAGHSNTIMTSGEVIQVDMSRLANVLGERDGQPAVVAWLSSKCNTEVLIVKKK